MKLAIITLVCLALCLACGRAAEAQPRTEDQQPAANKTYAQRAAAILSAVNREDGQRINSAHTLRVLDAFWAAYKPEKAPETPTAEQKAELFVRVLGAGIKNDLRNAEARQKAAAAAAAAAAEIDALDLSKPE